LYVWGILIMGFLLFWIWRPALSLAVVISISLVGSQPKEVLTRQNGSPLIFHIAFIKMKELWIRCCSLVPLLTFIQKDILKTYSRQVVECACPLIMICTVYEHTVLSQSVNVRNDDTAWFMKRSLLHFNFRKTPIRKWCHQYFDSLSIGWPLPWHRRPQPIGLQLNDSINPFRAMAYGHGKRQYHWKSHRLTKCHQLSHVVIKSNQIVLVTYTYLADVIADVAKCLCS
jgi:hypothetical protein